MLRHYQSLTTTSFMFNGPKSPAPSRTNRKYTVRERKNTSVPAPAGDRSQRDREPAQPENTVTEKDILAWIEELGL